MFGRWREYRQRQRAILDGARTRDFPGIPPDERSLGERSLGDRASGGPGGRRSPFVVGFYGGLGLAVAYGIVQAVGHLNPTLALLTVSAVFALSLNPVVEWLMTAGSVSRSGAVALVSLGVLVVFAILGLIVVPTLLTQGGELLVRAPRALDDLLANPTVRDLDAHYQFVDRTRAELDRAMRNGELWGQIFGGVLGAGKLIASGVFSTVTVLVLTLYFLVSLPTMKRAAYALVPASRRGRAEVLAEEIMRRVGSYAIGQIAVASINAVCSYFMMKIVGLPFAAVLSVLVGFLGLIPMVGATAGAVVVATVALFEDPRKAIIVLIYYLIYQQLENYVVMPRIMQHTVSVPGAITVVAALIGGTLFGVLGALLAIPVAAGLLLIYDEVVVPHQEAH